MLNAQTNPLFCLKNHRAGARAGGGWAGGDFANHRLAHDLVRKPAYDHCIGAIIMYNFVLTIIETDILAKDQGDLPDWMSASGWLTLLVFTLELTLRLYVYRRSFWWDGWNIFDLACVLHDQCSECSEHR